MNDTNGDPIIDPFGQPGFPGFDGVPAKVSLGYVAQMQEAGVPVTFGYISDAHDNHQNAFPAPPDPNGVFPRASGPGESDYVQTLHEYDQAFATFFDAAPPRRDHEAEHAVRRHRRRERPLRRRQLDRRHVELTRTATSTRASSAPRTRSARSTRTCSR